MTEKECPLCNPQGENVVLENARFRIIVAPDPQFPVYFRVIWKDHKKEMSSLTPEERRTVWEALEKVEEAMIETFKPEKINLAQFGNMVPHLHWHLIARWPQDPSFPDSIWSAPRREWDAAFRQEKEALLPECIKLIRKKFRS